MKLLIPLTLTVALVTTGAAAQDLSLRVDLSDRELVAEVEGEPVQRFPVAVGTEENPTPTGEFSIRKVILNPSWHPPDEKWARGKSAKDPWDPDNPMKRVKMFFQEPDYYIHGTGDKDSLGKAESHGCVRMHPEDVTDLAKIVMEHGGKPMPEPWWRRIFRSRATKVMMLSEPVPLEIVE